MKRYTKIIATVLAVCLCISLFSACSPVIKLGDVKGDPTNAVKTALLQTIDNINGISYNPITTGTKAVNAGKIVAEYTDTNGQGIKYTLNQNPEGKEYSTTMTNSADNSGWKWMLHNGTAYLQFGSSDAAYHSLDLQNIESATAVKNIANLLNISETKALQKIQGNYSAFLTAYSTNQAANGLNVDIVDTILSHIAECKVNVEETQVVKSSRSIDVIQVSYTVSSDEMSKMVSALKKVRANHTKMYDDYVDDLFRNILCSAGCDFYAETETENKVNKRWDITINELELYLLYSDQDFNISFCISQDTGNIVNMSMYSADTLDGENVIIQANLELDEKHEEESNWSFSLQVSGKNRQRYDSHIVLNGKIANGTNAFSNSIVFEYSSQHEVVKDSWLTEYDKQDNSFSVYTSRDNEELLVAGTVTVMGQEMRMTIRNVQHKGKDYDISVTITANGATDKSNAPTATDIETLSENSLKKIQNNIIKHFPESVFGSWVSEEDIDLSVFKTFLSNYDYDGDGDCGDDDDLITFTVYHNMLYRDERTD